MKVLLEKSQISKSRHDLEQRGLSCLVPSIRSYLIRFGLSRGVAVGDWVKSWDLLETLKFIEANLDKNAAILDIGCFASEILLVLHKAGYQNLFGVDLNSKLDQMPLSESIQYINGNFMQTKFSDSTFDAVTSISVIEHGYDGERLLSEMSRILKPGGYFIASFDYWPEKIDTSGVKFFDMDWTIFSSEDVENLVSAAGRFKLYPVDELIFSGKDRPIECASKHYTFAWLVLKKSD